MRLLSEHAVERQIHVGRCHVTYVNQLILWKLSAQTYDAWGVEVLFRSSSFFSQCQVGICVMNPCRYLN
jgi:hypothetical protein